ncbi:methyl-accepting chemotaxis protein [Roseateles sp. YR242]|uniref:methyl-accepting chemotaxis protein n=1 Tax=Roseateles sp. YR242 TaxID=1855305 RepID=UPI0008CD31A2|nr:methyl-accepting chemotaxis protein [Roseateles sp. YR242]SEL92076.1 methyl-accepting chemotaxis protein [Roseateles sp. YR242]
MSLLNNLSIRKRLALVLGVILLLCLASSLFAVSQIRTLSEHVELMMNDHLRAERLASDWYMHTFGGVQRTTAIAKSADQTLGDYLAPISAEGIKRTNELQKELETMIDTPEEKRLFAAVGEQRKAYLAARDDVYRLKKEGNAEAALKVFQEKLEPGSKVYLGTVQALAQEQRAQLNQSAQQVQALRRHTNTLLLTSAACALVLGLFLAVILGRSIIHPLVEAERMARAIADMDLRGKARAHYAADETGRLLRALDAMRLALQNALGQVRGVADGISTASTQIATGNSDLSARTEQTASNLEETAGAMEELTGTVGQTADAARSASQLASAASDAAAGGGSVVGQVVSTMDEINASSKKIGDIIGVIDGIAFQTNILALNAAVEAARAGEQGRGFAVVAGEVRTLAQRSAEAAREIKVLINASLDRVEAGAHLVRQAGESMHNIVSGVQRVTDIVGEIAVAANEQNLGIVQINVAVGQLDQMTQQNAALVEQSSAAAESLRDQAQKLADVVGEFRLN